MKNKQLSDYPLHVNLQTRWRDLDAFGHVNNAVFATYIETARGTLFKRWNLPYDGTGQSLIVASITIDYYQQLKHPTDIVVGQKITRLGTEVPFFLRKNMKKIEWCASLSANR